MLFYPEDAFFQAQFCLPPPGRVFGTRLLPYSVGHDYILTNLGNPILFDTAPTLADVLRFAEICGRRWADNQRLLTKDPTLADTIRRAARALRWSRVDAEAAAAQLRQYRDNFRRTRQHWNFPAKDGEQKTTAKAPAVFHVARRLWRDFGYSSNAFWDLPYGLAMSLWDVGAEARGDTTLMDRLDELVRHADEQRQKASAAGDHATAAVWQSEMIALCRAYRQVGDTNG